MAGTNWQKLHDMFHGNMNAAMYEWLADQLGVTPQSLRDLQIGWAPTILFKQGTKRGYGYLTIPQRDATGKIVGLALRDREGGKCVYPGTQPGCVYQVNPEHRKGDVAYSSGAHNWVRAMDAKELCPICNKPDGCLLSAEDVCNPNAVICRATPSEKKMKFGWLHIRKAAGDLSEKSLLAGDGPVLIVEGMSDAAAAATLGFTAVGRPGNMTGMDIAAELVRGRPVFVIGENDLKKDGKWPGRDGMVATFQTVKKHTFDTKMVMPPKTIKDLRSWIVTNGLDRETFLAYAEKHAEEKTDGVMVNADPMTVGKASLKDNRRMNKTYLLRRFADVWYTYIRSDGRYAPITEEQLRSEFYRWAEGKQYEEETPKGTVVKSYVGTPAAWAGVCQAMAAEVEIPELKALPAWINGAKGPNPKDLVVFNNGILDVPTYLGGEADYLLDTTPDLFNTTALPISFNPAATCPTWAAFLKSSLDDEESKIDLLQEWFGYCLTPDTSRQKLMYFRGESGSGKGTILGVLQSLVGATHHASSSLSQLAEPFGLQPLIGKLVCIIGDARVSKNMDAMRGLEVLLGITGNDAMQINRKFKDQLEGTVLTARITIASNDFLDVPDHSGAMLRRLNVIQFSRSFRDCPDPTLPARLAEETEGIATWALAGLKRLREQGFTEPASSRAALGEWERDTNPLISWLQDCTMAHPEVITSKDELYDCWCGWARDSHRQMWTRSVFLRRLHANASHLVDAGSGVKGITLTQNAGRRYLGKP